MDTPPDETPSTSSTYTLVDEVLGAAQDGIDAVLSGEHGVNAVSWFGHLERGDMVFDLSDSRECANTVVAQVGGEYFLVLVAKLAADHPEVALARRIERDYDERGHLRPVHPPTPPTADPTLP